MDMQIRLTASDLHENGVFDALKGLCLCFGSDRFAKITPSAEKIENNAPVAAAEQKKAVPVQSPITAASSVQTASASNTPQIPVAAPTEPYSAPHVPVAAPPTAAASFTGLQIAQAAAAYAETSDTARQNVVNLIHSFGVNTLNEIPQDKLGEFATGLRGLGARI